MFNFKRKRQNETQEQEIVQDAAAKSMKKPSSKGLDGSKVRKILLGVFLGVFLIITISNTIYSLEEDEYAVIQTWGQVEVVETPGIKVKIPFVQQVYKVSKASKQFAVGYDLETGESIYKESFMITSDYNFVNVDFYF